MSKLLRIGTKVKLTGAILAETVLEFCPFPLRKHVGRAVLL